MLLSFLQLLQLLLLLLLTASVWVVGLSEDASQHSCACCIQLPMLCPHAFTAAAADAAAVHGYYMQGSV
jgi:hypothetical protein